MFRSTKQPAALASLTTRFARGALFASLLLVAACAGTEAEPAQQNDEPELLNQSEVPQEATSQPESDEIEAAAPTVEAATTVAPEPEPTAASQTPELRAPTTPADDRFSVITVTADGNGPAGAEPADMDGDGDLDLVMNFFGDRGENPGPIEFPPGGITIFWNQGSLDSWIAEPVIAPDDGEYFPNEALPRDMDSDGDLDIMVGSGFFVCELNPEIGPCGALFWLENADGDWIRRDIVPAGSTGFYHRSEFADLDGDGIDDLITVAEFQADAQAEWYRGTGEGVQFETEARVIGQGGGSLPVAHDVDGDGDIDLASGEFFLEGSSYAWFENLAPPDDANPAGSWARHEIDASVGRTIQIAAIDDLYGDGTVGWVGSNHVPNREGSLPASIHLLTPAEDPRDHWEVTPISDNILSRESVGTAFQAAPGVFSWGDVDDDGDIDLAVSGDGDNRIFWFEQTAPGEFEQHVLAENLGQAGGGIVEDLDGDGDHEIVFTSYETHELMIFSLDNPGASSGDASAGTATAPAGLEESGAEPVWQTQVGSEAADTSFGVAALSTGDLVIAAATEGSLAGPNLGGRDIFLARYNSTGAEQWALQFGSEKNESPLGVSVADDDTFYVAGFTEGDFASPNQGSADVWLARFDADGEEIWRAQFGADGWDRGFDVTAAADGAYVTGYSASVLDPASDLEGFDGYVTRFDGEGNQEWLRHIGTDATDWGQGSALAPDDGVYVTGYTEGDFDGVNSGGKDIFVTRISAQGDTVWTRQIGTDALDWTQGVGQGSDGGVLITGSTEGSLAAPNAGGRDLVVASFDADGNELFVSQVGTPELDTGFEVRLIGDRIVVSGNSAGDLGAPAGDRDGLLAWFTLDGTLLSIDQIGSEAVDDITGIDIADSTTLVWSGYSYGSLFGDNAGDADLLVGALDASVN